VSSTELPLNGGNMTTGVVRVGDTVRRPAGPWTPAVHALLRHLGEVGFDGSPRSLGIDDEGRHVVEWIDGGLTHPYAPLSPVSPSLTDVGRQIRRFHDATTTFSPPDDAVWNTVIVPDRQVQIVHHDLAAWNFVHGTNRSVFIDWDLAGPGSVLWDLAWSAQSFAALAPNTAIDDAGRRLRALVDGYGLNDEERVRLIELLPVRYQAMRDLLAEGHRSGEQPWARLWSEGHGDSWARITAFATQHSVALLEALIT